MIFFRKWHIPPPCWARMKLLGILIFNSIFRLRTQLLHFYFFCFSIVIYILFKYFLNLYLFLIAASSILGGYYSAPKFFTIQRIWIVLGRCLFLRSVHTFWIILSQIGVVILVTPKQEMGRKSEWFCGVNFFDSNFKVEWENGVWTKIRFLGSGFFVHMRQFHSDFLLFFRFFGSDFFLNGFPNPFTAHSRPNFLFELNFYFSLVVFSLTCGILTLIFCFFSYFLSDF